MKGLRKEVEHAVADTKASEILSIPNLVALVGTLEANDYLPPTVQSTPQPVTREGVERMIRQVQSLLFPLEHRDHDFTDSAARVRQLGRFIWELSHLIYRSHPRPAETAATALELGPAFAIAQAVALALPQLQAVLREDVEAAFYGDPAATSRSEIVATYPGFYAIVVYRLAHMLHRHRVPLLPRMMTEVAHSLTGIDIHPGAVIGRQFFIDHGTGVVIGETTVIGDRATLYQGVTLGALNFPRDQNGQIIRGEKRHPTIEDDVVIYSGATILGGKTVIGRGSTVGGNVWLTESVPPGSKVLAQPEIEFRPQSNKSL